MKKISFLLCSFLASVTLFAGELTDGYEKVTDISSLTSSDKVILYCDESEVGVSGFSGYKDANVSSDAADWIQYEITPVSGGVLLYDPNAAQYIIQPGGNSFLYGTSNPMTCNISNGVFGGLDGTTQRYLCRNEDPTNGTFHRFYPNTNSTATTNKYPFYIYKVVEATPDIPIGKELTDGYEKVTDISSLQSNDKIVLYCDKAEVGVSGFSGYKDANVSSDAIDWVQYEVTPVSGGVLLYDSNAAQYIVQPGENSFLYGTSNPMTCNISNGVFGGLDGTTQRYLCRNTDPTHGTFHRFYPNTSSTATTTKYPFYIYKVVEETPIETYSLQYTTSTWDYTAEVSGYTGNPTNIIIPESVRIDGVTYNVTGIGMNAFKSCSDLVSITIPEGVTTIGEDAFRYCSKLTSISLPNSLTIIGKRAFDSCSSLTSITIPENVTNIGIYACRYCSALTSIIWNAKNCNGHEADKSPFYYSSSQITSFIFGDKVEYIPQYLCCDMSQLTSITIPNSITGINSLAFSGCSALTSVIWNAKNCADPYLSYAPFSSISSQIKSFTFGNDVEHIPAYLCYDMSSLTSITIPKNVTSIGDDAFSGCYGLTSVIWNAKNYADASQPFYSIRSQITSFMFGDDVESIPAYLCYNMGKLTSVSISNSVKTIGERAFSGCDLTSIAIPNSVTTIGSETFCECGNLTSVTIGNSVRSIGDRAFSWCHGLTAITIPGNVTSIGEGAFIYCSNLISITIPSSVISIGNRAFAVCEGLTSIVVENGNTMYDSRNNCNAIIETATNTLISGCKNTIIPNNVTSIGNWAFGGCYGLTSITIPESVTSIGDMAFGACEGLTSITIPGNVTTIGEDAFAECLNLTSVNIVNGVKSIGFGAFWNSSLTSITLPNSVTTIGDYAFDCEQLSEIRCAAKLPPRIVDEEGNIMSNNAKLVSDYNAVTLYVPCESQAAYYTHANWGQFNTIECMDENKYTVSVTCNADEGTVFGAGTYAEGTEVTLAAIPNKGYEFIQWSDGNTDNPRKIVVTGDVNLAAIFAKVNTALGDAISDQPAASKTIRNGQVCILRDGKVYDIMGNQIQ